MTAKELDRKFPWLHLICDACHAKLTSNPTKYNPFDLCERCQIKFKAWCDGI